MRMSPLRWLLTAIALPPVALAIAIVRAGVTLEVANRTAAAVGPVTVAYDGNIVKFPSIAPNDDVTVRLGKIGEGALFRITAHQNGGCRAADSDNYFDGLTLSTTMTFELLANGRVRVLENGRSKSEIAMEPCQ
jgi:hypothetical protein